MTCTGSPRVPARPAGYSAPRERHPAPALPGHPRRRPRCPPMADRARVRPCACGAPARSASGGAGVGSENPTVKESAMSNRSDPFEWTHEVVLSLRQLWDEGHSTAEIGRRLGLSKNAIVGKAHRLDLPGRPSPIRRDGGNTARAPRRPLVPQLADIVPLTTAVVVPARLLPETGRFPQRAAPAPTKPVAHDRVTLAPCSPGAVGNKPCCWPIGEPGARDFRFCDSLALIGKPYCDEHAQLAYHRVRRRDDDDRMAATD